ncbi:MAG TPA: phage major capsid protein [Anaerolineae bacterium]|nr:phage major capsid protein [Anaerolineae bacterium]
MAQTYQTSVDYTFNTVLTAHLREILQASPREQSYEKNALLMQLERTNKVRVDRGGYMHINVSNVPDQLDPAGPDAIARPYEGAQPASTDGFDDVTLAQFRRKLYAVPIKILHSEELDAGGERALFDLAAQKLKQAKRALENRLAFDLWQTAAVNGAMNGLPLAIPAAPTVGIWGNIDRAQAPWWQSKSTTAFGSFGANLDKLDSMSLQVTAGGGENWDWIVTDQTTFLRFKQQARTYLQINAGAPVSAAGKRLAEFGFSVVEYEGKPVIWDRQCPVGFLYFINNEALKLAVIPGEEFAMTPFVPLHASGQQGRIAYIRWAGQLITFEPRLLGQVSGIIA